MPAVLEGALRSLYRSYEKSFEHWEKNLRSIGEPHSTVSAFIHRFGTYVALRTEDRYVAHHADDQRFRAPLRLRHPHIRTPCRVYGRCPS